jgi:DNA replication and repair protein RecF
MGFRSLRFYNFRNIVDGELPVGSPEVFLIGENGQGKTNLIEAVYLLSFGSSFRTKKDEILVRHDAGEMAVGGVFEQADFPDVEVSVTIAGRQKEIRLDDKIVRDRREIIGRFPCIVFCHEDIGFITGTPDRQRTFFNQTLSLKDPLFLDVLRRYTKIVKQRNAAVKNRDAEMIELFDEEFITAGIEITRLRRELTGEFSAFFSRLYRDVSALEIPVGIRYLPSWQADDPDGVKELLNRRRESDYLFSTTTSGPHRDRFRFLFGGKDFTAAASTGQIRLASLILKTAQAAFFTARSGRLPVVLLDDVLLEMDPPRRRRFVAHFPPYEQAFFTFLPDEQFSSYAKSDTLIYKVSGGRFFVDG